MLPRDLSNIGCGIENTTTCEPVGHFYSPIAYNGSSTAWNPLFLGTWVILEADGSVSDRIVTYNDAQGRANLLFYSDPSLVPISRRAPTLRQ